MQSKAGAAGQLDIASNRSAMKYSRAELLGRLLWGLAWPLFRLSPRPCFGWRRFLLRIFGASVGKGVHIYSSARIYIPWQLRIGAWSAIGEDALIYNLGKVVIGERVTISHRAHICAGTHDHTQPDLPLLREPVWIDDQAWVCTEAFVGPRVRVGAGAVVGARAVVVRDVVPWTVVAGNPARAVKPRVLLCDSVPTRERGPGPVSSVSADAFA